MSRKNPKASYIKTIRHKAGIIRQRARTFQVELNYMGERDREPFLTLAEAKAWIEQRQIEIRNEGVAALALTKDERADAAKALGLLEGCTSLEAAARFYMIHNSAVEKISLADAIDLHLDHIASHLDGKSVRGRRSVLKGFLAYRSDVPLVEVSRNDIYNYINIYRSNKSAKTREGDRSDLSPFFAFAVGRNYLKENPVAGVSIEGKKTYKPKPKGILTPLQMQSLLAAARELGHHPIVAAIVLIGFVGVRKSELHRINWENVSFDKKYVFISELDDKIAQSRYIKLEPNALEWLKSVKQESGTVCAEAMYKRYWKEIVTAAKIKPWPSNALRHSYGSYFLQRDEKMDAALVAFNMGNTVAVVNRYYRKPVSPEQVKQYWKIYPE